MQNYFKLIPACFKLKNLRYAWFSSLKRRFTKLKIILHSYLAKNLLAEMRKTPLLRASKQYYHHNRYNGNESENPTRRR